MRTHRDALVALLPPKASGRPNPGPVDPQIYPFDFRRMGFHQWTSPPGCVRSAHGNTSEHGPAPTHCKITYASARRGRFLPPSAGDVAVHEGGHTPEPRAGCLHPPPHFQTCMRAQRKSLGHSYPTKAPDHTRRHARNNPERGIFPLTFSSQKIMKNDNTSYITCVYTV